MKDNASPQIDYVAPALPRIIAAMVYDSLLLAAISIAYGAIIVASHVIVFGVPDVGQRIQWGLWAEVLITLGWLLLIMTFYVFFWHKFGQTLGMKTWRIQLIDAQTHQGVSYAQSCKRSFYALCSLILFGVGYWYQLFHPQRRLLHDLLSGTQLILLKKK